MKKMKRAFTLTELLISLAILGTIAVFAIPPLMSDIHTRVYLNLLKNMSVTIEQLAADQMLNTRSHNLPDTDFGSAGTLLTTRHFAIVSSGENLLNQQYKSINSAVLENPGVGGSSALLKNGVVLVYSPVENDAVSAGTFAIDVNGNDGPNVAGKDLFIFDITKKGKLIPGANVDTSLETCQAGNPRSCYGYVINNGWKYPN